MKPVSVPLITLTIIAMLAATPALANGFYRLESLLKLPSTAPSWDYLALDTAHARLFIAQRRDGATVVDTKHNRIVGTIEGSKGANAFALATPFNRGYVVTQKGTAVIFRLSDLAGLGTIRFGDNADGATFDPATGQVVVTMPDSDGVAFIAGATGELRGVVHIESKGEIESPVADGIGNVYVTLRNRNAVAKINATRLALDAIWHTGKCIQPTGLAYDRVHKRLFAGCRGGGVHPLLAIMDATDGRVVTTFPIGRGCDGVVYDRGSREVITANGVDGDIVVYHQIDANTYKLEEATTTRPYARTVAMDHHSNRLYLVTAQGTADPSKTIKTGIAPFYPNRYFAGTFVLLSYSRR